MKILYIAVHSHTGWGAEYWLSQAFSDLQIGIETVDYRLERKLKSDSEYKKMISSKKKKGYKETKSGLFSGFSGHLKGYNKELESLWKDLSDTKKLVFIMKDKSYKIMKTNRSKYESLI